MNIHLYLSGRKKIIDKAILACVPKGSKYTKALHDAVRYSLMSGGKRIRPILVLAACEAVSGSYRKAIPAAVAIEMIHTYTLIHDDLPAMDDDDLRRGKPTCHRAFGEDTAILAGDLLNTLAFEMIAKSYDMLSGRIINELASSLGIAGVVGGQYADLKSSGKKISLNELKFISSRKTACLFIASVSIGAIAGGASIPELKELKEYAANLGLAFQIIDDILDYRKKVKNSYPAILGMEQSRIEAQKKLKIALNALPDKKGYRTLVQMAEFLAKRRS